MGDGEKLHPSSSSTSNRTTIYHYPSVNNCALKAALYSRSPHAILGMGTLDDLMFSFHLWLIAALPYRFHMVNKVNLPITAPNLPQRLE